MTNENLNQFAKVPTNQTLKRSIFDLSHSIKFTAKVGELIPFSCIEIMPGDTFNINQSNLMRSLTPVFPTMDNGYFDVFWFFIPNRLCFLNDDYKPNKIWEQINGENINSIWANSTEIVSTMVNLNGKTVAPQSTYDYLGLPIGTSSIDEYINPAPAICVALVYNEFFRDQNVENPITDFGTWAKTTAFSSCLKVNKFHDYFTSALPAPQKGDPVKIGLAETAPITAKNGELYDLGDAMGLYSETTGGSLIRYDTTNNPWKVVASTSATDPLNITKTNLKVDLAGASAVSINDLRLAFATQKMLERDARAGTRFIENLYTRWNVVIKDETLQRPQYIGGKRIPLNISQVNQTSETSTTPLGNTGAFSLTTGDTISFTSSFKENGYLIGFVCFRLSNTYKHGIPKMFSRKKRLDFYNPEFANIGEQPIYNKELFYNSTSATDNDKVFGYKEAWSEYRYQENQLKGYFKDTTDLTLNSWTYSQNFSTLPTLNSDFLNQSRVPFQKTLSATTGNYDFICDVFIDVKASRPMPTFSIPSLIDHN